MYVFLLKENQRQYYYRYNICTYNNHQFSAIFHSLLRLMQLYIVTQDKLTML